MIKELEKVAGWETASLEQLFEFKKGQGLSKDKLNPDGKNPCLLYGELYTTYSEVIKGVRSRTYAHEGVPSVAGDVLIPASTTTSALDVATATALETDNVLLGGDINILRKKNRKEVDSRFIAYLLSHTEKRKLARFAQGSTIVHLYGRHIRKLKINLPEQVAEQHQIVSVLEDFKSAVEEMQLVVSKQEKILEGVLQDLFKYGIDSHGIIRKEQSHKFSTTSLGRLPSDWKMYPMRELLSANPRNGIYKPASDIGSGTLLVGQTSFTKHGSLDYSLARRANVSKKEIEAFSLKVGDILISRVFATAEGVGRPVLIDLIPEQAVYESNMLKLSVNSDLIFPQLLFHWLKTDAVRKKLVAQINSSNQSSINQQALNALPIAVPDMQEQERILTVLGVASVEMDKSLAVLNKLKRVRNGLIQDLLVGSVRINSAIHT